MFLETTQAIIANFAIVTAYLFLDSQIFFKSLSMESPETKHAKIKTALFTSILGIILMIFTVHIHGTILDFRQFAIIISALFGGPLSPILTGTILCITRLFIFGELNSGTVIAAINTIVVGVGVGMIFAGSLTYWKKWIGSILLCNILTTVVFFVNLGTKGVIPSLIYFVMTSVGGLFVASLAQFLINAKSQFYRMKKDAAFDFLTGLHNLRSFDDKFNLLLHNAINNKECLSLAMVDIDYFKKVNDTYGHSNGDTVLKQLAEVLKTSSRPVDTISRNGGEEFSVLFYDASHRHALLLAERIRAAVENYSFILNDGQKIKLTVSIGVATYPDTCDGELKEQADKALYMSKSNGRNLVSSNR